MKKLLSLVLTGAVFAAASARADAPPMNAPQDRDYTACACLDLKSGYPLQVQDAYAIPTGEIRLQSTFTFDRRVGTDSRHGDLFSMKPEIQYGITPTIYAHALIPVYTGSGPTRTTGDVIGGVFWNFLDETNGRPAMGISADLEIPTGTRSAGLDTLLYYYVTKNIGTGLGHDRVHANIGWIHNSGGYPDEREDLYVIRAGYSRMMFPDTLVGVDFVREKLRQQHLTENIIEIGALHSMSRWLNLSVTLGVGMCDESPDYRIGGGVQLKWN
jgi:hypothetical protein